MVRWYAVDDVGNVWWFGQQVAPHGPPLDRLAPRSWQAGRAGAEAGLVLTATPREGDGYYNGQQPRVVQRRSTVVSLTGTVATTRRTFRHAVVTRDLSSLAPLHTVQSYFGRGLGLVAEQDTTSVSTSLSLVRISRRADATAGGGSGCARRPGRRAPASASPAGAAGPAGRRLPAVPCCGG